MLNQFTRQYSLSKTLRFELKPVGETADYLEDFKSTYLRDVVDRDQKRAEDYKIVKDVMDKYHKKYIDDCLGNPCNEKGELYVDDDKLNKAYEAYKAVRADSKDKKSKKEWIDIQTGLRKCLVRCFVDSNELFEKEMITQRLPKFVEQTVVDEKIKQEQLDAIGSFSRFTTYFKGFYENRKNMYSAEDQSTAISYRLMNENLSKHFSNCMVFGEISEKYQSLRFSVDDSILLKLGIRDVSEVFKPSFFMSLFTQSGIDAYQELIGGISEKEGIKVQGLNEQINLYRQQNGLKSSQIPRMLPLYKQILSDRETRSFSLEGFKDDKELLNALSTFVDSACSDDGIIKKLGVVLEKIANADLPRVYTKNASLSDISSRVFKSHGLIKAALTQHAESVYVPSAPSVKITSKLQKQRDDYLDQDVYSLAELDQAVSSYLSGLEEDTPLNGVDKQKPISMYFVSAIKKAIEEKDESGTTFNTHLETAKSLFALDALSKQRNMPKNEGDFGGEGYQQIQKIHALLDAMMVILHVAKPLHLVNNKKPIEIFDIDSDFYGEFIEVYEKYSIELVDLYNQTRNYLTKKPFSTDKIKINFDAPTFMDGWDLNKEIDNKAFLLKGGSNYYLAVVCKDGRDLSFEFDEDFTGEFFEKLNYKLLSGANKMLPKLFFSKKGIERFKPSLEIIEIYKSGSFKKSEVSFDIRRCHKLIDFFKEKLPSYKVNDGDKYGYEVFDFKFSKTSDYRDISEFYKEVERCGYKTWFSKVPKSYLDDCVRTGKIAIFQIYNKDFSEHSSGSPNLHTLYWRGIFDQENMANPVIKLNGEAEMFYREHSIQKSERTIHRSGENIANKNANNQKKESLFEYDLIKDRRYTKDKFFFHVPVTLNFGTSSPSWFNDKINKAIKSEKDIHIIGIDRGERHLLYYTVINQKGEIIKQGSLNDIETDQGYTVDYQKKLKEKEEQRDAARKSWSTVENIKELKEGYLSQVVHKLSKLIVEHNAVVCLEDLNFGFKRGRFAVERQVYQKFERALIQKLNYLVLKDRKHGEPGHYANAYQLTAPFESFEKLGKQTGILFYVPAAYTSKIDPMTGFVNLLDTRYESQEKSKDFFGRFNSISYNKTKDYFEFYFDYKNFPARVDFTGCRTAWTACTYGDVRYANQKNNHGKWETKSVNVTEGLKKLFDSASIKWDVGDNIKDDICKADDKNFYSTLSWLLKLTLSLRHSKTGTDDDFVLSPIADADGNFFDSRKATAMQPKDADANGAYHIACKGLWYLEKIQEWDGGSKLDLLMKTNDWFQFVQRASDI